MGVLGRLGQATSATAARELGVSHGLAAHHIQQLAKYGFVEQVEGKDHRERPWRLVATSYDWKGANATAEGTAAIDMLEQILAGQVLDGSSPGSSGGRTGRRPGGTTRMSADVYLTRDGTRGGGRDDQRAAAPLCQRAPDRRRGVPAGPGSVPVDFTLFTLPFAGTPPRRTEMRAAWRLLAASATCGWCCRPG